MNNTSNNSKNDSRWPWFTKKALIAVATIAIFCVTFVAIQAGEMAPGGDSASSWAWNWTVIGWMLWLPAIALTLFSLIVSKRQGWGWVVVGSLLVAVLLMLQFAWSIITSFRGDPADDEDYFKPLDSWTSDSF